MSTLKFDCNELLTNAEDRDKLLNAFRLNGAVIVENAISSDQIEALKSSAERFAETRSDGLPKHAPYLHMETAAVEYGDLIRNKNIVSVAEILTNGLVDVVQAMFYYKPPGYAGFKKHQDNFYLRTEPASAFVTAWVAIDDADNKNGGLIGYPGSHREDIYDIIETTAEVHQDQSIDFFNERKFECVIPKKYKKTPIAMKSGGVIFLHSLFVHESDTNISKTRFRRAIAIDYVKQGKKFREGNTSKRKRTSVY